MSAHDGRPDAVPEAPLEPPSAARRGWPSRLVAGAVAATLVAGGIAALAGRDRRSGLPKLALGAPSAAGGAATDAASAASLRPAQLRRFVRAGAWPRLAAETVVWRLAAPDLDAAAVARIARAFGIGEPPRATATGWTAGTDGSLMLMVDRTPSATMVSVYAAAPPGNSAGGVSSGSTGTAIGGTGGTGGSGSAAASPTSDPSPMPPIPEPAPKPTKPVPVPEPLPMPTVPPPRNLPPPAEAERRARAVLEAAGVLASGDWRVEVTDGGTVGVAVGCASFALCRASATAGSAPAGKAVPVVMSRNVAFRRVVDGRDVGGLDWYVEIGDEGALLAASGALGSLVAVGRYPLRSVDAAFADLQAGRSGWPGEPQPLALARDLAGRAEAPTGAAPGASEPGAPGTSTSPPDAGKAVEPPAEPPVAPPSTTVEPPAEPVVVTIDTVTLASAVVTGRAGGDDGMFVVPVYRFQGRAADGTEVTVDEPALDESFLSPLSPPATEPGAGVEPVEPVEPGGPPTPGANGSLPAKTPQATLRE